MTYHERTRLCFAAVLLGAGHD
ncbi:hypothetical protein LCGC14_2414570, partial [marine sediment metagenome]